MGDLLSQLDALCEAEHWCDAFDLWRGCPASALRDAASGRDAWLAFLCGETRLLHHACEQAVARRETAYIRDWYDSLQSHEKPRPKSLYARFDVVHLSSQHIDAVTDLIKAAGLALTARAIAKATRPLSAIENLCGCLDGVSLDEPDDAPTGRRLAALSGDGGEPADVLDALLQVHRQKAVHLPQSIRLARIEERVRAWLEVPKQVTGGPRQVPIAYVIGAPGKEQGRADQMLEVDIITPGTGRAFHHADDMLLMSPPSKPHQRESTLQPLPGGFAEDFIEAMQYAFTTACHLAGCHGVDARWRLFRGTRPEAEGGGASASGQALRAFYGALKGTVPEPGVILLAQVTADGRLDRVDYVPAKTRAIAAVVQAKRRKKPGVALAELAFVMQAGECDTIAVTPENEREAEEALRTCQDGAELRVVRVSIASDVVQDRASPEAVSQSIRSRLTTEILAYLKDLAGRLGTLPSYYPDHLRQGQAGQRGFDAIYQRVQVIEDRAAFARQQAEARERLRAAGRDLDMLMSAPHRARLDQDPQGDPAPPQPYLPPVPWDEAASARFPRAIILGDPGFGKTWLLYYEARRLALQASDALQRHIGSPQDVHLPIYLRLSELPTRPATLGSALVEYVSDGYSETFRRFVHDKMRTRSAN